MPGNDFAGARSWNPSKRFAQNQLVIGSLAGIPSEFGRLADVAVLREVTTGSYRHPALEEAYPASTVHHALLYCHEELFQKVIERRLSARNGICACILPEWTLQPLRLLRVGWNSNISVHLFLSACRHTCRIYFLRTLAPCSGLFVQSQTAVAATA